jgi:predicted acylesterase/phospholipase RssA
MAYQREVRLGIVLYGGVSLAVYENGVAQELHRAIRGDGVYGLLKKLIDSDIVVDIVSGTSAGGVNGVMLARALTKKRTFAPSAELWRQQGDIQALLRTEDDPAATSILNSVYYQNKLEDCLGSTLKDDSSMPDIEELDLFITGTDANGDIYTVYDDQGHAIDVKNHRALFKLSYRKGGRKDDVGDATPADLAKLARITSCFPVAFEPVSITRDDKPFFRWGKLRNPAVYMDGGILNNKPFTSTIDAIARRTANKEVERFLIYVEPDPEVFCVQAALTQAQSPTVVQAALSALVSIPGYQSIAADLEAIEAHNERAGRVAEIIERIKDAPDAGADCLDKAGVLAANVKDCDDTAYYAARLIQLRDTAVGGILNYPEGRAYISSPEDRRAGRILVQSFDAWPGDALLTLTQYDVFFRMRRANHLSHSLMRRVKARKTVPESTWDLVNHYFKIYEMTEWAMVTWFTQWDYDWKRLGPAYPQLDTQPEEERRKTLEAISIEVWQEAEKRLRLLITSDIAVPADPTPEAREAYYKQLSEQLKTGISPAVPPRNLLDAIDDSFKAALKSLPDDEVGKLLRNEFCRFPEVDRQLFPIVLGSGFESTDVVRVVRFSPLDAQRALSEGKVTEKVCGSALGAFGGFFKKSWRANDIMMGRLDGACQLLECLLTKERLAALPAGRTVTEAEVTKAFPSIGAAAAGLVKTINTYLAAPRDATPETWDDLINQIVAACHNEIAKEEWPRVVRCALEQEYAWGRYRQKIADPFDRKNLVWNRGKAKPDQLLAAVAANAIASGVIPPFTPGAVAGRDFLEELPETVLQELGFLSVIRIGKSLLASIPNQETRKKVEGTTIYKWPFVWIVPILYRWARMRRTKPDSVVIFNTAIPVACLAILIADAVLFLFGVHLDWRLWAGLVGAPVVLLGVWAILFRK